MSTGPRLFGGRLFGERLYGGTLPNYDFTVEFFFQNADSTAELEKIRTLVLCSLRRSFSKNTYPVACVIKCIYLYLYNYI